MTALCAKAGAAVRKLSREMQTTRMIHLCRSPHNFPDLKRKHGRHRSMAARLSGVFETDSAGHRLLNLVTRWRLSMLSFPAEWAGRHLRQAGRDQRGA